MGNLYFEVFNVNDLPLLSPALLIDVLQVTRGLKISSVSHMLSESQKLP
jgi:hypothetical protein